MFWQGVRKSLPALRKKARRFFAAGACRKIFSKDRRVLLTNAARQCILYIQKSIGQGTIYCAFTRRLFATGGKACRNEQTFWLFGLARQGKLRGSGKPDTPSTWATCASELPFFIFFLIFGGGKMQNQFHPGDRGAIDVRGFIQKNYTPSGGGADFLCPPTARTRAMLAKVQALWRAESERAACSISTPAASLPS